MSTFLTKAKFCRVTPTEFGFRFGFVESITAYQRLIIGLSSVYHRLIIGVMWSVSSQVRLTSDRGLLVGCFNIFYGCFSIFLWEQFTCTVTCSKRATEDKNRGHLDYLFFIKENFTSYSVNMPHHWAGFLTCAVNLASKSSYASDRVIVPLVIRLRKWKCSGKRHSIF